MSITLNKDNLRGFLSDADFAELTGRIAQTHNDLEKGRGKGAEYTGWLHLSSKTSDKFLSELKKLGQEVQKSSDAVINIGIGGSYLGIRAAEEFLKEDLKLPIYYAGQNLSSDDYAGLFSALKKKKVTAVVISKSGTTTEPALGFRLVKKFMVAKYRAKELKKRIICVTDEKNGALRKIADKEGYRSFVIPDDVGGRFSVLTPVGLVPLALAGVDIKSLVEGARAAEREFASADLASNACYQYAASRYMIYQKGRVIEVLSSFYPRMAYVLEWWKQLFGESEGKEGKGIFPASLNLTADLHSMGQLMQEGMRNVFETFLQIETPRRALSIPKDKNNLDDFNFVAGRDLDFVNKQAYAATAYAHREGRVPNMTISIPKADAYSLGELFYFFEKSVAISGYLLGVNPFNQPGVEAYKKKMFELLGKK